MHRTNEGSAPRHFESKAALARAAGTGDGDESRAVLVEEGLDACQRVLAADQPMVESGKARRRQRLQRREFLAKPRC
jgi:hypothetical protein